MKAKRVRGTNFICGCGAQFEMSIVFPDNACIRETKCGNCEVRYRFEKISRYTVTPLPPAKT